MATPAGMSSTAGALYLSPTQPEGWRNVVSGRRFPYGHDNIHLEMGIHFILLFRTQPERSLKAM